MSNPRGIIQRALGNMGFASVAMSGPIFRHASDGYTAKAGGGQALATPLVASINRVTVAATAGDSVLLLPADAGRENFVVNNTANSINVFPQTGASINALGANTAFAVAAGKTCIFVCPADGFWYAILSA